MACEIIDIHPHILSADTRKYPSVPIRGKQSLWSRQRPQTLETLAAEMDGAGVTKAAIVQASTFYGFDNSYLADSIATDPKRFTGVCTIDVLAPDAVAVLQGWIERGMSGLRLFTGGSSHAADTSLLTDARSFPVWEYCSDRGVPVCVQTSPEGLSQVHFLLKKFTLAKVILDHVARPMLDDGPPYRAAQSLFDLAVYPNLYLKITPRTFALAKSGKSTPETFFHQLVQTFSSNRIAYGSNLPANEGPMLELIAQARAGLASLPATDQINILSGTAKTLYPVLM